MAGCFFNQGQVCAAASRLYIQQSAFDRVVGELQNAMQALTLGPGLDPSATLQPLVTARHRNRVAELVSRAREQGVEVVTGGQAPTRPGYYFEPTLLVNAAADNTAMREEIFGPVITATPVRDLDHAIACANDTRYGLAASVWTRDLNAALSAVRRIKAGTVWVNSHIPVDPSLPFGGFKHSGYGREHGSAAIDAYTESKSVCIPVF
jgi:phenylacetaldehyde dehydrogenase